MYRCPNRKCDLRMICSDAKPHAHNHICVIGGKGEKCPKCVPVRPKRKASLRALTRAGETRQGWGALPSAEGWHLWRPQFGMPAVCLFVTPFHVTPAERKNGFSRSLADPPASWRVLVPVPCLTSPKGYRLAWLRRRTVGNVAGQWGRKVAD